MKARKVAKKLDRPIDWRIAQKEAKVLAHDPIAAELAQKEINNKNVLFYEDIEKLIDDADAILIMTAWDSYKGLHKHINETKKDIFVIDGRRILSKKKFQNYAGIGLSK